MSNQELAADVTVRRAARATARRLAAEFGPELKTQVETALNAQGADRPPKQYSVDPISLGALIVSAATLAWTIYKDQRNQTQSPTRETITQRIRIELPSSDAIPQTQRDRVIEVISEEIATDLDGG
ncbi:hypothetical protein ACFWM0_06195 [Streptomyces sp. NPDC058405]|uniref:hypothetical protein n=1 Tax=unclassified Streptomyces TaxID=2593676 RepID=UPI00365C170C